MFRDLREVEKYFVYEYQHLDDLRFLRSPEDVLYVDPGQPPVEQWVAKVDEFLRRHGWEGDGAIRIMWFPPFAPVGVQDTHGTYAWVVKQNNNGTSFIASGVELPFNRLLAQNRDHIVWQGLVPVGLARGGREMLVERLGNLSAALTSDLDAVASIGARSAGVRKALLERTQGQMVQELHALLDEVYLRLLVHVISEGNRSGLKLRKSSVNLNPANYQPDDGEDTSDWFTLNGLVRDMWRDYKFEPFREKLDMLLRPVDFKMSAEADQVLRQHVAMRNSVQHHEGRLDASELKRLGVSTLELQGPGAANITLKAGSEISFPLAELERFDRVLREFAAALDAHVEERVSGRFYVKPEEAEPFRLRSP